MVMVVDTDPLFFGNGCSHRLYLAEIVFTLAIWQNLAEKLTRRDFDVSMTSCLHYQENEENLHK